MDHSPYNNVLLKNNKPAIKKKSMIDFKNKHGRIIGSDAGKVFRKGPMAFRWTSSVDSRKVLVCLGKLRPSKACGIKGKERERERKRGLGEREKHREGETELEVGELEC